MAPAGSEHGATIINLTVPLGQHVKSRRLGVVFGAETGFIISHDPDSVRAPDIAFVSQSRIPSSGIPKKFFPGAPDLAVEVVSPGDTFEEVHEKVADWLAAGTRIVWVVNPKHRTVTVYKPGPQVQVLAEKDQLTGEDVVPGFACGVGELFV